MPAIDAKYLVCQEVMSWNSIRAPALLVCGHVATCVSCYDTWNKGKLIKYCPICKIGQTIAPIRVDLGNTLQVSYDRVDIKNVVKPNSGRLLEAVSSSANGVQISYTVRVQRSDADLMRVQAKTTVVDNEIACNSFDIAMKQAGVQSLGVERQSICAIHGIDQEIMESKTLTVDEKDWWHAGRNIYFLLLKRHLVLFVWVVNSATVSIYPCIWQPRRLLGCRRRTRRTRHIRLVFYSHIL